MRHLTGSFANAAVSIAGFALGALLFAALLSGCASPAPKAVKEPAPGDIRLGEVRGQPDKYVGATVRWGGTIAAVDNHPEATSIEVVAYPLDGGGRPEETDASEGRFIARFQGFLDPAIYAPGRLLTVRGVLEKSVTRPIGDYPYRYPLVNVAAHHLWEPLPQPEPWDYGPYWYDPWYRPYYPYYPYYPYFPPYPPHRHR